MTKQEKTALNMARFIRSQTLTLLEKLNELDADEQADICESLHDHADELYRSNSYPYYQDKKEKDFSLRSNPLKKHKRPHFLMWSFILQLKHPLVQQTKIG